MIALVATGIPSETAAQDPRDVIRQGVSVNRYVLPSVFEYDASVADDWRRLRDIIRSANNLPPGFNDVDGAMQTAIALLYELNDANIACKKANTRQPCATAQSRFRAALSTAGRTVDQQWSNVHYMRRDLERQFPRFTEADECEARIDQENAAYWKRIASLRIARPNTATLRAIQSEQTRHRTKMQEISQSRHCSVDEELQADKARQISALGPLKLFVEALNAAIDGVPGLSRAIQTGAELSEQQAREIRDRYNFAKSPYAGIRLVGDALLQEYSQAQKLLPVFRGVKGQLRKLLTRVATGVEGERNALITGIEAAEEATALEAYAAADARAARRLTVLTNPGRIQQLKDTLRGANSRLNKIMYYLYQEEQRGGDPAALLRTVVNENGITGREARLIASNLIFNYRFLKSVSAFAHDANLISLRAGKSAVVPNVFGPKGNGTYLWVDHVVPTSLAPELGRNLANLRYSVDVINRDIGNMIEGDTVDLAEALLSPDEYDRFLRRVAEYYPDQRIINSLEPGKLRRRP
jgi:hypothetical protein